MHHPDAQLVTPGDRLTTESVFDLCPVSVLDMRRITCGSMGTSWQTSEGFTLSFTDWSADEPTYGQSCNTDAFRSDIEKEACVIVGKKLTRPVGWLDLPCDFEAFHSEASAVSLDFTPTCTVCYVPQSPSTSTTASTSTSIATASNEMPTSTSVVITTTNQTTASFGQSPSSTKTSASIGTNIEMSPRSEEKSAPSIAIIAAIAVFVLVAIVAVFVLLARLKKRNQERNTVAPNNSNRLEARYATCVDGI